MKRLLREEQPLFFGIAPPDLADAGARPSTAPRDFTLQFFADGYTAAERGRRGACRMTSYKNQLRTSYSLGGTRMRSVIGLLVGPASALALTLGLAGTAGAKTLDWNGTLDISFGQTGSIRMEGSGVATVNNSTGGNHLNIMRLAGGITGSGVIVLTDPESTGTIQSYRMSQTLGTGTISGISGAPPLNPSVTVPVPGFTRVCLLVPGCGTNISLNATTNNGNTGLGVGGLLTVGKFGQVRISLIAAAWTLGTTSAISQTHEGNFKTKSVAGWVHGAASSNSSTAEPSGVIQLISPMQVTTSGITGNNTSTTLFARLTLHFIPEPGLLLLIGSGVVGLALLGVNRTKR